MGEARLLNLLNIAAWLNHMLASVPFLHAPRRLYASSKPPRSMSVHAKAKTRNQQTSNGRKRCKEHMKRHKVDKHDKHGKQRSQKASKQEKRQTSRKANKRWCPGGDKSRFGSDVHNFIVLKHGRHTSKQDSCMDM